MIITCDCSATYRVPDKYAGTVRVCKRCEKLIKVPHKRKALWNKCPDCCEEVLWMPYEDRCGKCGFGGKPITTSFEPAEASSSRRRGILVAILLFVVICLAIMVKLGMVT